MKKIISGLLLIAASTQLKAQQLVKPTTPDLKLNDGLQQPFKPEATPSPKSLLLQPSNTNMAPLTVNLNNIIVNDRMPVVKVFSTDRMPIIVPGDPNTKYTMLVKKVEINITPTTSTPQP